MTIFLEVKPLQKLCDTVRTIPDWSVCHVAVLQWEGMRQMCSWTTPQNKSINQSICFNIFGTSTYN